MRRRRARPQTTPLEEQIGSAAQRLLRRIVGQAESPERIALLRYEIFRIRQAISQLAEEQRIVFTLGHLEELPYAEIGEILGIPVGTVKSRMHYALARLRKLVED